MGCWAFRLQYPSDIVAQQLFFTIVSVLFCCLSVYIMQTFLCIKLLYFEAEEILSIVNLSLHIDKGAAKVNMVRELPSRYFQSQAG